MTASLAEWRNFYKGRRVLVTGHTGFKGAWLCEILLGLGAEVFGYALPPESGEALFSLLQLEGRMSSYIGDVADLVAFKAAYDVFSPEIVLHLAAQPIVRHGYEKPVFTYQTNVMGTVHLLECVRTAAVHPLSVLNVTTDKVYQNNEWEWGYRENDRLDGFDPYSNSKSCSELVTHCYFQAFLRDLGIPVSTARAGNVIGGGDIARDRIIPDCVRAAGAGEQICVRNPHSVRPYQHVLEPLFAYLLIAYRQAENKIFSGSYNIGPNDEDCVCTQELADIFCRCWPGAHWRAVENTGPHEANFLKLDCSHLKSVLGWRPLWNVATAVEKTVVWSRAHLAGEEMAAVTRQQIKEYMGEE